MRARPEFLQEGNVVHGAILTAIADTCSVYLFFPDLEAGRSMASIEFKVNFINSATLGHGTMKAIAHTVKRGRTVAVSEVEVFQSKQLVLKGLFTYFFLDRPPLKK